MRRLFLYLAALFITAACDQQSSLPTAPIAPSEVGEPEWSMPSFAIALGDFSTAVNGQSGGGSLTIPRPDDVQEGDFLLAQVTFEKGADINNLVSPANWILVRRTNSINPTSGTDLGQAILYKVATSAEPPSYEWQFRKGSSLEQVRAAGGITRLTGVNLLHPNGPILGSSGGAGDGTTLTAPSIDALDDAVLVAFFGHKKLTTLTDPMGMANLYQMQHSNQSGPTIRASTETLTADGATGSRVSKASAQVGGDKWIAQLVALRSNTIPVYTPPADQEADEGEDKAFDLGSFVDPDAHVKWIIMVNWGDGDEETFDYDNPFPADPLASRDLGTRNHTYDDNDTYTVTVTVDDGTDSDSDMFQVTVANVVPTATLTNDGPKNVGEQVTVSFINPSDPSQADTDAGFHYAFSCTNGDLSGATYATAGTSSSTSCTFVTAGMHTVKGRIIDKDDGFSEYTTVVTVNAVGFTYYLHNNPTPPTGNTGRQANLPFDTTPPTATTLFNYNTTDDSNAGVTGRFIDKISAADALTTTDLQKFQTWRTGVLASDLTVAGNVELRIWAKMKASGKNIQLRAFLRECTSTTEASCVTFATGNMTAVSNASTTFQEYTLSFPSVPSTIVNTGNRLQLRVVMLDISNSDPAYLAYDTVSHPARVIVP